MTTQADTREAVQAAVEWLTAKHKRHGEIEDKQAADLIEAQATALTELRAECERLRGCLTKAVIDDLQADCAAWRKRATAAEARVAELTTFIGELRDKLIDGRAVEYRSANGFKIEQARTHAEAQITAYIARRLAGITNGGREGVEG